jgi:hypothetical protein
MEQQQRDYQHLMDQRAKEANQKMAEQEKRTSALQRQIADDRRAATLAAQAVVAANSAETGLPSSTPANDEQRTSPKKGAPTTTKIHPLHDALMQRQTSPIESMMVDEPYDTRNGAAFLNLHRRLPSSTTAPNDARVNASRAATASAGGRQNTSFTLPELQGSHPATQASESQRYANTEAFIRLKDLAYRRMVDARPREPFARGSSIDFTMHMALFNAATDDRTLNSGDKLQEMLQWFAGDAKRIVQNHYMSRDKDMALASAISELESIYKESRDSFSATIQRISRGKQIAANDHDGHVALYSELREAQTVVKVSASPDEFNRRDIIRQVLASRLTHLTDRFWREDEKSTRREGRPYGFEDLLREIGIWISILRAKGVDYAAPEKKAPQIAAVTSSNVSEKKKSTYNNVVAHSPPKTQPQAVQCNLCGTRHSTQDCNVLGEQSVEQRVETLMKKGLCFHCMCPGHSARMCTDKPICAKCGKRHATLLHDRKYDAPQQRARSNLSSSALPFRPTTSSTANPSTTPASASGEGGVEVPENNTVI